MDIFLLFIFNIFTGAVIFLILSLKIEKTSSTFQERKLRREMGEIITEFNSTAERNITLLENRISILKKMLNDNGSLHGVDFTVLDDAMKNNTRPEEKVLLKKSIDKNKKEIKKDIIEDKVNNVKDDHKIIGNFIDKIQSFTKIEDNMFSESKQKSNQVIADKKIDIKTDDYFSNFENDTSSKRSRIDISVDEDINLKYEEDKPVDIEELFQTTEDKYLLIAKLFNEGHSVDELSKHSGLPAGEIKLVISLNS